MAQRLGCRVISIKLYPIFGFTKFERPWSKFDHCLIAWAGVIAQSLVAIPIILWVRCFGYSRFELINIVFALFFFSVSW